MTVTWWSGLLWLRVSVRLRGPARSALFPYTTLFRSMMVAPGTASRMALQVARARVVYWAASGFGLQKPDAAQYTTRSEEHTSELQSRQYLVCRLLREKKKTTTRRPATTSAALTVCSI